MPTQISMPSMPSETQILLALGKLSGVVLSAMPPSFDYEDISSFHAALCDNGASQGSGCTKLLDGAIPGTYWAKDAGEIAVGDASTTLGSDGSYLYMHERIGSNNKGEIVLRRLKHTPNLSITTVYDEATENELGYDIKWPAKQSRSLTSPTGTELKLIMSTNKLGWLKVRPVTDPQKMARLLNEFMKTGAPALNINTPPSSAATLTNMAYATD